MASAVENATIVLFAMNENYFRSRYCRLGESDHRKICHNYGPIQSTYIYMYLEAEYTVIKNKHCIPLKMEANFQPVDWLALITAGWHAIDFSGSNFEAAFQRLRLSIEFILFHLKHQPSLISPRKL